MRRGVFKVVDKFMGEAGAAELAAQIEAAKRKGSEAYSEIDHLEAERRGAETFEAARAIDDKIARLRFEIDRVDLLLPQLERQLADTRWAEREAAFAKHKLTLGAAARKAIPAIEAAARANAEVVAARHQACQELGDSHAAVLPSLFFGGMLFQDLVGAWRRQTEQQLAAMENAELTRPPKPRPSGTPQAPSGGRVVLAEPAPAPMVDPPAKAVQPAPVAPQQPPAAPARAPKREARRDPPPGSGERQVHIVAGGDFQLPDGSRAKIGDRINLTSKLADIWVGKGVAEFVDLPEPVVGDLKATMNLTLTGGAR